MSAPPGIPLRRKPTAPARDSEWMDRIACRDSSIDFVSEFDREIQRAKQVCLVCPVRTPCVEYGRARRLTGVFGGLELVVGRVPTR